MKENETEKGVFPETSSVDDEQALNLIIMLIFVQTDKKGTFVYR